jgi:hypothetical protein
MGIREMKQPKKLAIPETCCVLMSSIQTFLLKMFIKQRIRISHYTVFERQIDWRNGSYDHNKLRSIRLHHVGCDCATPRSVGLPRSWVGLAVAERVVQRGRGGATTSPDDSGGAR